jgi:cysteine desulfurase
LAKNSSIHNKYTGTIKYLDSASTTKVDQRVLDEMLPYFTEFFGNASSNHSFGKKSKNAIEKARQQVSEIISCDSKEVIFTSGATESINLALKGYVESNSYKGNHIITAKTEHKAVLATCEYLETIGYEVTYLDVDENGLISLHQLEDSIREETLLIAVMYVNNETGVIQLIKDIGSISRQNDIVFFCDATQAIGKIEVDVNEDNIDMLCFSGHKLNGPKGIGVLFKKRDIELTPLFHGGGQESGLRAGTYNTPLIVGLGKACELAKHEYDKNIQKLNKKREEMEKYFEDNNIGQVNFKNANKSPHIISITLNEHEAEEFLMMKSKEFMASTGSACNAEIIEASHVLKAIDLKYPEKIIRISIEN